MGSASESVKMLRSCLLFPLVLALAHSACVLEVDDENIFLSRMPGTWEIDIDMSEALAPSTYQSFNVAELTITRNDSNIESFYGEECDEGDFTLHMTGFAETTNFQNESTVYNFAVSTYKGNPVITILCLSWTTSPLSLTACWPPARTLR